MTGEPELARQPCCMTPRSMRADIIDHVKERTWKLLRRIAIMSEDQTMCSCNNRVCSEFFHRGTGGDDCLYESRVAHVWNTELNMYTSCAHWRETSGIELSGL